jgi:hypothetical protein
MIFASSVIIDKKFKVRNEKESKRVELVLDTSVVVVVGIRDRKKVLTLISPSLPARQR